METFNNGWRPAIGWICGACIVYAALIEPMARFIATVIFGYTGLFPTIDTNLTLQVVFIMFGLGVMRSYDKKQGTSK